MDCVITAIASPTAPDEGNGWTLTYNVYDSGLVIDLSTIEYPQTELCGYTVTEVFTWTIPGGAPITVDPGNAEAVIVYTTDKTQHNTYTLTLLNTITHVDDGTFTPSMTFDVDVLDPCRTTTINTVDVTAGITVRLGETQTLDFSEATDSVEVAAAVDTLCGDFSYSIVDPNNGDTVISWISIAPASAGLYTITASPTDESFRDSSPNSYELWTTLDSYYPAHHVGRRDTIVLTVEDAVCDCS